MMCCLQPDRRRFRPEEMICKFSSDEVGIIEQGEAAPIRIDEDGAPTVPESLGPGGASGLCRVRDGYPGGAMPQAL